MNTRKPADSASGFSFVRSMMATDEATAQLITLLTKLLDTFPNKQSPLVGIEICPAAHGDSRVLVFHLTPRKRGGVGKSFTLTSMGRIFPQGTMRS